MAEASVKLAGAMVPASVRALATVRDKRFILAALLTAAVVGYFWAGSRYPALNEKMLMAEHAPIGDLAFSPLIKISADEKVLPHIAYATVNWMYTNRQGMTFAILFGALVMTILALIDVRSFRSRLANAALGMVIGAPMGVCANCAAPIGKAIHAAGGRAETMLAAMFSSPTLNVVVLTMVFGMFPTYVGVIKVGLTVTVILIGIPLLTRAFGLPDAVAAGHGPGATLSLRPSGVPGWTSTAGSAVPWDSSASWPKAARWVGESFLRNLWFIVKTTVPLMLLAGLLGSIVITLVPLDSLAGLVSRGGRVMTWLMMAGVAAIGLFLPVPMAFDVIVTAVLWQSGLPVRYVLILLFTLGIFSIYPFMIVWRALKPAIAVALVVGLAGVGMAAGIMGDQYYKWDFRRQQEFMFATFGGASASLRGPKVLRVGGETREERPDGELVAALERSALTSSAVGFASRDGISVERLAFEAPVGRGAPATPAKAFTRLDGSQIGLDEPYSFSVLRFEGPFAQFRGVASGDVHNDGWMDLLLTSDQGLSLYANLRGKGFALQRVAIPALRDFYTVNAALVDLNNDGWLDIFFSTYQHGSYVIYNSKGRFLGEHLHRLPTPDNTIITGAAAFGDVDRDGWLDIVLGNWLPPCRAWQPCDYRPSNDYLLRNARDGFEIREPFKDLPGRQTLNLLLSDINQDGNLDLIVGVEDYAPDAYYLGRGDGNFRPVTRDAGIIPYSTGSTMSVVSGDIDNDLRPEIYLGQITVFPPKQMSRLGEVGPALCDEIVRPEHKKSCLEMMTVHRSLPTQTKQRDVFKCLSAELQDYREDCIAYSLLLWGRKAGPESLCDLFPDQWATFRFNCHLAYREKSGPLTTGARPSKTANGARGVDVQMEHNVLLASTGDGRFTDKAGDMGVRIAGFTWNAKFADTDNDEFVDLYAVNGWFPDTSREPHIFYHNEQGKKFVDQTTATGLGSRLPTSAYTYVDLDNDGDLDIVAVPVVGPVQVYVNNATGSRIAFELHDRVGNRSGVGSKVIIHYGPGGTRHQVREVQASGGFISFDAPVAYFGLGEFRQVERVEVQWSTGERSEIRGDFTAGVRYVITRASISH